MMEFVFIKSVCLRACLNFVQSIFYASFITLKTGKPMLLLSVQNAKQNL